MVFDTDEGTVFQIRPQHRNEEVREVIPADYGGVMVTDRARQFGTKLKELLRGSIQLWREKKHGDVADYGERVDQIEG